MPENKLLLFEKWDVAGIKVQDQGLQKAISLKPSIAVTTLGRHEHKKFGKLEVNIVASCKHDHAFWQEIRKECWKNGRKEATGTENSELCPRYHCSQDGTKSCRGSG